MTRWTRAVGETTCGGYVCEGRRIPRGDPVLERSIVGVSAGRRFTRCVACAAKLGMAPPADLPPLRERTITVRPMVKASALARAPLFVGTLDWKYAAANDREPGEDDE